MIIASPIAGVSFRAANRPTVDEHCAVRFGAFRLQLDPRQVRPGKCVVVQRCGVDDWDVLDLHGRPLRFTASQVLEAA